MEFTYKGSKLQNAKTRLNSNPELLVTNIEFMDSYHLTKNPMKLLMNRERRKEMIRRTIHIIYSSLGKRPSTTGNVVNKYE